MTRLTEDQIACIEEAIESIRYNMQRAADAHYNTFIFEPDYRGQTYYDKYIAMYCKQEVAICTGLREIIAAAEADTEETTV